MAAIPVHALPELYYPLGLLFRSYASILVIKIPYSIFSASKIGALAARSWKGPNRPKYAAQQLVLVSSVTNTLEVIQIVCTYNSISHWIRIMVPLFLWNCCITQIAHGLGQIRIMFTVNAKWDSHPDSYPVKLIIDIGPYTNSEPIVHLVLVRNLLQKHRKTAAFLTDTLWNVNAAKLLSPNKLDKRFGILCSARCWPTCTFKTDNLFDNGDPIPNLLRPIFHSQIKIKCLMKM